MAAADGFSSFRSSLESPAADAVAVSPHDTNELSRVTRALYVGGAGNLVVTMAGTGGGDVTFTGVPAGTILPIRVKKVLSTNTTATSIVALW